MQDKISSLARRLIGTEDPDEFRPLAAELRSEIHECVRRVQLRAVRMVLRGRLSPGRPAAAIPSEESNR